MKINKWQLVNKYDRFWLWINTKANYRECFDPNKNPNESTK